MDEKDRSKVSDQELQAERDKIAADLRSVPKDDARHKELETRYSEIQKEQTSRAGKAGQTLTDDQRKTFRPGEEPELRYYPKGTKFEKFADSDRGPGNSPYYSSSESVTLKDGRHAAGMKELSERYNGDQEKLQQHARSRFAVSYEWDTKVNQRVEVELNEGRYGYVGQAKHQPYDKESHEMQKRGEKGDISWIGGDHQTVLPGIKQDDYTVRAKGDSIPGTKEEQRERNEAATALKTPPRDPPDAAERRRANIKLVQPPPRSASAPPTPTDPDKGRSR